LIVSLPTSMPTCACGVLEKRPMCVVSTSC
jgi:hypothetical protein